MSLLKQAPPKYRLKRRAERQAATRRRIVRAAVELHTTIGPARTTDAGIAKLASVTRVTFYRHFPDAVSLFRACATDDLEMWPPPNPKSWRRFSDPVERLRAALTELYGYYRTAGSGLAVIIRDRPLLRPELFVSPSRFDAISAAPRVLAEGWGTRGRRIRLLRAALSHAVSVETWQSLVQQQGLEDGEAIALLVAVVRVAAGPKDSLNKPPKRLPGRSAVGDAVVGM